jgi:uncharacterized protein YecT (DUF1311 family)
MKTSLVAAVAVLFPLWSGLAQAAPTDYRAMYSKCLSQAGGTNNGSVAQCARQTSESLDPEMRRLYNKIYSQIAARQPKDAQQFELAQKAWLSYRDTHCKLAGAYVGSPMYAYCPMQLSITRIVELRELAGE